MPREALFTCDACYEEAKEFSYVCVFRAFDERLFRHEGNSFGRFWCLRVQHLGPTWSNPTRIRIGRK